MAAAAGKKEEAGPLSGFFFFAHCNTVYGIASVRGTAGQT
jgi:hypothetical protein